MDALVGGLLSWLQGWAAPDVCPGGWAWATTALGVLIGLVPTAGAVAIALWRRRIGSRYTAVRLATLVAIGVVSSGIVLGVGFATTGGLFRRAAAGLTVPGLSRAEQVDLARHACFVGSQRGYLGGASVADSFDTADPIQMVVSLVLLLVLPLVVALLVLTQARLALRRGPHWPSRFFWLPVLVAALLTGPLPAGATGQLWIGVTIASALGVVVLLFVGVPSPSALAAAEARSAEAPPAEARPSEALPAAPARASPVAPTGQVNGARRRTALAASPPGPARFHIVRRLGSGGFGGVWLATDTKLGRTVALKSAHVPDPGTEQRIRREARALATVRHPHCVRIHDFVHSSSDAGLSALDGLVIVMEYVEGPSLGQLVQARGPLDDVATGRLWANMAGALAAAHQRGVLHRDVKPSNIIVDRGFRAHLIDFGIARTAGDVTLTATGFVLGTPDFLSPEVARGGEANGASDTWQLAATMSYALTGRPPRGGHRDALAGLRAAAGPGRPNHLPAHSAHLALLQACLADDPRQRPPLTDVRRALEDWLRMVGAAMGPPVASRPTAGALPRPS